jgi:Protein of unknown function (DUF3052)
MGQQANCKLKFAGKIVEGTAWLEHKDLVFRGPERLAIPLRDITSATVKAGRLLVAFDDRTAEFDIGDAAAKWADRITNPPSRLDKLGIKPDSTVLSMKFEDEAFDVELRARGARLVQTAPAGGVDAVFFGAERRDDLRRLEAAIALLKPNGALWVVRPKGTKAITEAETMAAGKRAGLVDVKVVSFSDTHTAEKFVIPVAKRAKPSRVSPPTRKR